MLLFWKILRGGHYVLIRKVKLTHSFVRRMGLEKTSNFKIVRINDEKTSTILEGAIKFGQTVLIEGVTEKLSADLEPILVPQFKTKGKNISIKLGDKEIDYNPEFKF